MEKAWINNFHYLYSRKFEISQAKQDRNRQNQAINNNDHRRKNSSFTVKDLTFELIAHVSHTQTTILN